MYHFYVNNVIYLSSSFVDGHCIVRAWCTLTRYCQSHSFGNKTLLFVIDLYRIRLDMYIIYVCICIYIYTYI